MHDGSAVRVDELRVLQLNIGHCRVAQSLALQEARTQGAEVLLLCEVYEPPTNNNNWAFDTSATVAIVATGSHPIQRVWCTASPGMVAAQIGGVVFVSCYAPPRWNITEFERLLESVELEAMSHSAVVVAGDFNARHTEWGSTRCTERGELLLEAVQSLRLQTLNRGDAPTFDGNGVATASRIDVTFASNSICIEDTWEVQATYTASDHRLLSFRVRKPAAAGQRAAGGGGRARGARQRRGPRSRPSNTASDQGRTVHAGRRWKTTQFNKVAFLLALSAANFEERSSTADGIIDALVDACSDTMQRVPTAHHGRRNASVFWWTPELERLKEECRAARDAMLRETDLQRRSYAAAAHRAAKRALQVGIKDSREHEMELLIAAAEDEEFGDGFRVVMARLSGARVPPETDRAELDRIVGDLFPTHQPVVWPEPTREASTAPMRPVTTEELLALAAEMPTRKAPGLDGIPNAAVKASIVQYPEAFRRMYQRCLDGGTFPAEWKRQRLALIPKTGKPPGISSSYRPLCMIDVLGKVLERLILNRLNDYVEQPDSPQLSDWQYGFRRGRSTVAAAERVIAACRPVMSVHRSNGINTRCVMLVALDVRNAFNNASWQAIAAALRDKGVPVCLQRILEDYFRDRHLVYETSEGPVVRDVTAGVPQGSILGPTLWNIMYDGVLGVALPPGAEIVGYADDLVLLCPGVSLEACKDTAERAVEAVSSWMERHLLELAPEKTEMTVISTLRDTNVTINVGGVEIRSSDSIRYLGVRIHRKLLWLPHVQAVSEKAERVVQAVTRLLPHHSGPRTSKARLLAAVAESVIRYAAPIWHAAVNRREAQRVLNRVQRKAASAVARTFRTTSHEVATLIAGMVPICRHIKEDARVYERLHGGQRTQDISREDVKREERDRTLREWQADRDREAADGGASRFQRWTHRLIPDVAAWQSRNHGDVTFHLSQVLSGHGFFREYLCRMGFTSSPDCRMCPTIPETVEHAMFECPRFADARAPLYSANGQAPVTPDNLVAFMCQSPGNWSLACEMASRVTTELQREWKEYRIRMAAEHLDGYAQRVADRDTAREAMAIARNDRRNINRNIERARLRELEQAGRPPPRPPSPTTLQRRREVRRRVRRFRRRRQRRLGGVRRLLAGNRGSDSDQSGLSDDDSSESSGSSDESSSSSPEEEEESRGGGLSGAEAAAASEAEASSR